MKILHINTSQNGGAALCARRINQALIHEGIESKMLFAEGMSMPDGVEGAIAKKDWNIWYANPLLGRIKHLLMRLPWYMDVEKMDLCLERYNTDNLYIHHPYSNYKNIAHHSLVEWADIIHLHWVPAFVDYPTFFRSVNKPIVWTLHDEYPAIGVMHFCSEFSPLPNELKDVDAKCRKIKKNCLLGTSSLHTVAISSKMQKLCLESEILKPFACTRIHNSVDTSIFKPIYSFGDNKDVKTFLFSSYNIWDKRKGLDRVIEALEMLNGVKKELIVIGKNEGEKIPNASFPITCTGLIHNQVELSTIYSSADYFIQASYQEAFAQTPLEAMACGTPVISTPVSGASDLIHSFNGVVCDGYDSFHIYSGIKEALSIDYDSKLIRQHIINNFDSSIIAKQYVELYNSILKGL